VCPQCLSAASIKDYLPRTWRDADSGSGLRVHLRARVPRLKCPKHGVKQLQVPWARRLSHFTRRFEASARVLLQQEGVSAVARRLRITYAQATEIAEPARRLRKIQPFPQGARLLLTPATAADMLEMSEKELDRVLKQGALAYEYARDKSLVIPLEGVARYLKALDRHRAEQRAKQAADTARDRQHEDRLRAQGRMCAGCPRIFDRPRRVGHGRNAWCDDCRPVARKLRRGRGAS
jgi:hypothetical protein